MVRLKNVGCGMSDLATQQDTADAQPHPPSPSALCAPTIQNTQSTRISSAHASSLSSIGQLSFKIIYILQAYIHRKFWIWIAWFGDKFDKFHTVIWWYQYQWREWSSTSLPVIKQNKKINPQFTILFSLVKRKSRVSISHQSIYQ